jgi:cyclophilin family peptidyl-prolyl cis-trans isomerase
MRLRPAATSTRSVGPGETLKGTVSFPAVVAGDLTLTALWGEGEVRRTAKPLVVEVAPKNGPPKRLLAQVDTSAGLITVELDGAAAFNAASHFWRFVREGFYDRLTFHRVEPGLLAQGGCPRGDGTMGTGWTLPSEGDGRPLAHGAFGLSRGSHADTACCQFFAVSDREGRAATALKAAWTPLGRVVEGQEVVDAMVALECDPKTGLLKAPPAIRSVRAVVK